MKKLTLMVLALSVSELAFANGGSCGVLIKNNQDRGTLHFKDERDLDRARIQLKNVGQGNSKPTAYVTLKRIDETLGMEAIPIKYEFKTHHKDGGAQDISDVTLSSDGSGNTFPYYNGPGVFSNARYNVKAILQATPEEAPAGELRTGLIISILCGN